MVGTKISERARTTESLTTRWARRALTIPGYILISGATLLALPFLLLPALTFDLAMGKRLGATRCVLALALYVCCEAVGLLASFAVWLGSGVWAGGSRDRFVGWNYQLQNLWARALFHGAARIFSMRVTAEGTSEIGDGPLFVFIRHASIVDTVLPAVFVEHPCGFRLRYVMKRELLWDPCLDVVGQRTRHVFVRRGSQEGAAEIAAVGALANDLQPHEGVLLYPEGTRATPEKRQRILERMTVAADSRVAVAAELRHTLPPKLGGAQALLEARPDIDVLFFAHVGFDGVETLHDLWSGALVGREIRVTMWRVAAVDIPQSRSERAVWLDCQWSRLDRWIGEHLEQEPGAMLPEVGRPSSSGRRE